MKAYLTRLDENGKPTSRKFDVHVNDKGELAHSIYRKAEDLTHAQCVQLMDEGFKKQKGSNYKIEFIHNS